MENLDVLANSEHNPSLLAKSICSFNAIDINLRFGRSIYSYFQFVFLNGIVNIFVGIVSFMFIILRYGFYYANGVNVVSDVNVVNSTINNSSITNINIYNTPTLFLSSPLITEKNKWSGTYIAIVTLILSLSIFLSIYTKWRNNDRSGIKIKSISINNIKTNTIEDPHLGQYDIGTDYCINENTDKISKWISLRNRPKSYIILVRIFISIVFIGVFIAYYYCQVFLYNLSDNISGGYSSLTATMDPYSILIPDINPENFQLSGNYNIYNFGAQIIVSLCFVLIDLLWRLCCTLLTSLEAHKYSTSFRKSNCFKSFFSRIIMFNIFNIVHQSNSQTINLLLLNTLLAPFIDLLSIYLYNKICFCICCTSTSRNSDSEFQLLFNLADEYTQLLFRQYLINQTCLYIPIAPFIGLLGCIIEYWTDKYKLLKLCKHPERNNSQFVFLTALFMFVNLLALPFSYPYGWVFQYV